MFKHKITGFTLIELAVVIAIIAILAAIAIPRFQGATLAAERTNALELRRTLISGYGLFTSETSGPPQTFTDFVTDGTPTNNQSVSIQGFANGGCQIAAQTITCGANDFPKLTEDIGTNVIYRLDDGIVNVNF